VETVSVMAGIQGVERRNFAGHDSIWELNNLLVTGPLLYMVRYGCFFGAGMFYLIDVVLTGESSQHGA